MNCGPFESMLADAVGGELGPKESAVLHQHLAVCAACRAEYESLRATVGRLQATAAPPEVVVFRSGDRLVVELRQTAKPNPWLGRLGTITRYAASVAIAFLAGYSAHALWPSGQPATGMPRTGPVPSFPAVAVHTARSESLQTALVRAYARHPAGSDLAKCLIAMAAAKH